jgi:hypothetical protein
MIPMLRRRPWLIGIAVVIVIPLLAGGIFLMRPQGRPTPAPTDVAGTLRAAPLGRQISTITVADETITLDFTVSAGPTIAETRHSTRIQVCNYLLALQAVTVPYTTVLLRGSYQGAPVVTLRYPAATVTHNDWGGSEVIDTVYTLAASAELDPRFQEP